ncbi:hypothetical protein D3C85_1321580 [compost metagenome]
MPSAAPVRLTVAAHGIPDGWPVHVCDVRSPQELNTVSADDLRKAAEGQADLPAPSLFARVVDADTIEFNGLVALGWKAYSSGGVLVLNQPADLTGWSARATVRDRVGGTVLLEFSSTQADGSAGQILVDVARSQFVLALDAATTAGLTWARGVWEMEATDPDGKVFALVGISQVRVIGEVVI